MNQKFSKAIVNGSNHIGYCLIEWWLIDVQIKIILCDNRWGKIQHVCTWAAQAQSVSSSIRPADTPHVHILHTVKPLCSASPSLVAGHLMGAKWTVIELLVPGAALLPQGLGCPVNGPASCAGPIAEVKEGAQTGETLPSTLTTTIEDTLWAGWTYQLLYGLFSI